MNKYKITDLKEFLYGKEGTAFSPEEKFEIIANNYMNYKTLNYCNNEYRIVECEFYYNDKNAHADIYTHGSDEQYTCGKWYDHYSGLDITIGNNELGICGGILIRGIYSKKINDFINGPLKLKHELSFNLCDVDQSKQINIPFFTDDIHWKTNDDKIYRTKRQGLTVTKSGQEDFINRAYRFIIKEIDGKINPLYKKLPKQD